MTQIIRTVGELEKLDPDTILMQHKKGFGTRCMDGAFWWLTACEIRDDYIFPLVVIATGEQARAAEQALEKESE